MTVMMMIVMLLMETMMMVMMMLMRLILMRMMTGIMIMKIMMMLLMLLMLLFYVHSLTITVYITTTCIGRELTPAIGFTALTLFNILRYPLNSLPEMINYLIRTRVALRRIEIFLNTPNVRGINKTPAVPNHNLHNPHNPHQVSINIGRIEMIDLTFGWLPTLKHSNNNDDGDDHNDGDHKSSMNQHGKDGFVSDEQQQRNCCSFIRRYSNEAFNQSKKYLPVSSNKATSTSSVNIKTVSDIKDKTLKYSLIDEDDEEDEDYYHNNYDKHHMYSNGVELGTIRNKMNSDDSKTLHYSVAPTEELSGDEAKFSGTIMIENTSLIIPPKSLTIIVGVTGSGKSSLLHGNDTIHHICMVLASTCSFIISV
jgi:ABC-type multidrug transport system fused ATPase/permease subunit